MRPSVSNLVSSLVYVLLECRVVACGGGGQGGQLPPPPWNNSKNISVAFPESLRVATKSY